MGGLTRDGEIAIARQAIQDLIDQEKRLNRRQRSFMVIAALIAVGLRINGAYVETWLVALVIYAMIFMGIEMDRIQIRVAKGAEEIKVLLLEVAHARKGVDKL